MKYSNLKIILPSILVNLLFYCNSSYAYLDPVTGGAIIQILLATFATIIAYLSLFYKNTKKILKNVYKSFKKKYEKFFL